MTNWNTIGFTALHDWVNVYSTGYERAIIDHPCPGVLIQEGVSPQGERQTRAVFADPLGVNAGELCPVSDCDDARDDVYMMSMPANRCLATDVLLDIAGTLRAAVAGERRAAGADLADDEPPPDPDADDAAPPPDADRFMRSVRLDAEAAHNRAHQPKGTHHV